MVKVKATAALQILATDKYNAMQLVELAMRVLRTDASAGDDEQRSSALESAVADLIKELPRKLAGRQEKSQTPLERQFHGAVEWGAEEEMLIAAGDAPPDLLHELQERGDS